LCRQRLTIHAGNYAPENPLLDRLKSVQQLEVHLREFVGHGRRMLIVQDHLATAPASQYSAPHQHPLFHQPPGHSWQWQLWWQVAAAAQEFQHRVLDCIFGIALLRQPAPGLGAKGRQQRCQLGLQIHRIARFKPNTVTAGDHG